MVANQIGVKVTFGPLIPAFDVKMRQQGPVHACGLALRIGGQERVPTAGWLALSEAQLAATAPQLRLPRLRRARAASWHRALPAIRRRMIEIGTEYRGEW